MTEAATMERPLVLIRASSLAELFDCPARWEAKHILGMRGPRSAPAQLGTAVHAGTAIFDAGRLPGGTPVSISDAADAVVDAIQHPEEDVDWADVSKRDAEKVALALHTKYCAEIAPKQTYLSVELTCEKLELPELGFALTGTNDRIRLVGGKRGITDLKTGKAAVGADGKAVAQKHAIQLGVYELLAEHAMGIRIEAPAQVVGMNTGKTPAAQRIGVAEVPNARQALVGKEGEPGLLEHAAQILRTGSFHGNPSSYLCSAKYCPRHSVCEFRAGAF